MRAAVAPANRQATPLTRITDHRRTRRVVTDGVLYDVETLLGGPIAPPLIVTIVNG